MFYGTHCYYVYILSNVHRSVLYAGVSNDLRRRLPEHYGNRHSKRSVTGRYRVHYLLYYEADRYILNAIAREKELTDWSRARKMALIATQNPGLRFLNDRFFDRWPPGDG
ncbi:MAG: GIY-YIG nuclease family protein [Chitinophagaceae bacterium]|nr:MAG: GIY-YIG nuclease family protein [Chitinophagaceae bacterium]